MSERELCRIRLTEELQSAVQRLESCQVPDARTDAWLLMEECFGISRSRYYMEGRLQEEYPREVLERYRSLVGQRAERIPLQYLLGKQEFMGLPFEVGPSVLIPRQDTEILVETVLAYGRQRPQARVLDVCTGSGCIAIALAHYGSFASVEAVDISPQAIETAKKNNAVNHTQVCFVRSDLLRAVSGQFDIIVSNPPYIERKEIEALEPEVRDFEPRLALDGGEDGLDFYRRILEELPGHAAPEAAVFFEIGWNEGSAVRSLFVRHGYESPQIVKDLSGKDRVVWARRTL